MNKDQADVALASLRPAQYSVLKREDKPTKSKPSAPFITSTLQQAASTRLGFGVKKTMMMAQRLYEGGYITYMRTDSTNLSADAVAACREYIQLRHGDKYLPDQAIVYSSKSGAQDAHEAIRPSNVDIAPGSLSDMEVDARRLYQLIWQQFIACQMTNAEFTSTTVTVSAGDYELTAKGRVTRFDGYLAVMPLNRKGDDDIELPDLQKNDLMAMLTLIPQQHFTKPVARFSEAALVKELEKRGIGRPSTYASIISTIQDRGYVKIENRRIFAEKSVTLLLTVCRKVLLTSWITVLQPPWKNALMKLRRALWTGRVCSMIFIRISANKFGLPKSLIRGCVPTLRRKLRSLAGCVSVR